MLREGERAQLEHPAPEAPGRRGRSEALRAGALVGLLAPALVASMETRATLPARADALPSPLPAATVASAWLVRRMPLPELKRRLDGGERLVVVDDRVATYGDIIPGAVWVPYTRIAEWARDRPRDEPIVVYCA